VGIDCERLDRKLKFTCERVAKRMFSVEEREELLGARHPHSSPTLRTHNTLASQIAITCLSDHAW
jgi:hypothetical protein